MPPVPCLTCRGRWRPPPSGGRVPAVGRYCGACTPQHVVLRAWTPLGPTMTPLQGGLFVLVGSHAIEAQCDINDKLSYMEVRCPLSTCAALVVARSTGGGGEQLSPYCGSLGARGP